MAQTYAMPPDTNEEENIIGGYINKYQLIWLVAGAGIGAIFTFAFFRLLGPASLILLLPPLGAGCIFAFKKVENMPLFTYLRYKRKFNKATKDYANFGNHKEICMIVTEEDLENYD